MKSEHKRKFSVMTVILIWLWCDCKNLDEVMALRASYTICHGGMH